MMTGFGLGWVNAAADYSRYLPRGSSSRGVVGWTTFGASVAPLLLLVFGLLLAGSSTDAQHGHRRRPDRRADHDPAHLVPDPLRGRRRARPGRRRGPGHLLLRPRPARRGPARAALSGGAHRRRPDDRGLDLHRLLHATTSWASSSASSPRWASPSRAWCGVMLADLALRRRDYDEADLFRAGGRYGDVPLQPLLLTLAATALGWGLVTNTAAELAGVAGLSARPARASAARRAPGPTPTWASSLALAVGFLGTLALGRGRVRAQEAGPSRPAGRQEVLGAHEPTGTSRSAGRHRHAARLRRAGQPLGHAPLRRGRRRGTPIAAGLRRNASPSPGSSRPRSPSAPGAPTTNSGPSRCGHRTTGSGNWWTNSPPTPGTWWTPRPSASGPRNWPSGSVPRAVWCSPESVRTAACCPPRWPPPTPARRCWVVADACAGVGRRLARQGPADHGPVPAADPGRHRGRGARLGRVSA